MNWTKFNNSFKMDGISLGCLIMPLLECGSVVGAFKILKLDRIEQTPSKKSDLRAYMLLFALRKVLSTSEDIKSKLSRPKQEESGKRDVFFLAFSNQIFEDDKGKLEFLGFNDVVKELRQRGKKLMVLIADPISRNSLFGLRKYDSVLYSHIDREIVKESKKIAGGLHSTWKNLDEKTKMKMVDIQDRRDWWGIKNKMDFLMSNEILSILIKYYMIYKKIIQKHDISIVYITALRGFYELPLIAAAHKLDRVILLASHGGGRTKLDRFPKEFIANIFIAAWGEWHRKKAVGISKDRIFVTGSPFLDKIAKYRVKRSVSKKKTVLFTTKAVYETPYIDKDEYFKKYVPKFLSQTNEAKGVDKIIMKLHPIEAGKYISEYEKVISSLGLNIHINQQLEKDVLYSLIRDSDLLISYGSAVDVEGLMLDRDVIVIDGLKAPSPCKDAVFRIDKDGDLKTAVELVLNDKKTQLEIKTKREKYVRALAKIDGKAYKRVADLIISLINKREKCSKQIKHL